MLHKTRAIIFHKQNYSESSIIVKAYTELFGLQSYIIKGARKPKARMRSNLFYPLALLDLEVYHKEKQQLQNIREVKVALHCPSFSTDIIKGTIVLFLAEVLKKSIKEHEGNNDLFEYIYNAVQYFDLQEEKYSNFHIFFLVHLTRHLGFLPLGNYSEDQPVFDLMEGKFIKYIPPHTYYIKDSEASFLSRFLSSSLEDQAGIKASGEHRSMMLNQLLTYYRLHLEGFGEVKSVGVIKEILK